MARRGRKRLSIHQRVSNYTDKSGPGGCWLWTGYKVKKGYGQITIRGIKKMAHRVSWELLNGPIPKGLFACHKCDNPPCVNPDHLFLGTHQDNMADMVAKGRAAGAHYTGGGRKGEKHHDAKLTETKVRVIRSYLKSGILQEDLAKSFGVQPAAISKIKTGLRWRHVV